MIYKAENREEVQHTRKEFMIPFILMDHIKSLYSKYDTKVLNEGIIMDINNEDIYSIEFIFKK